MNSNIDHNEPAAQLLDILRLNEGKFEAKLTTDERCQILALRMIGMSIGAIAVAFGVNRRTVTHIQNPASPRYKSVRSLRDSMGEHAFRQRFVTQDVVDRVKAAAATPEANQPYIKHDDARDSHPNKRANRCSGITIHKGPNHIHSHRVEIGWVEGLAGYPDGWYHKLLDAPDAADVENWGGDPEAKSHHTSASALQYARNYLDDNY